MIKGIDVSNHQATFPTSGYDFCLIKATEGRTFVDPRQGAHAARARTAGLVTGFYHFLWPGNIQEQAAYFVERCASQPGDILACDWEHTSAGSAASGAEKDAFLREVKRLRPDHKVLLYCNTDFWLHRDTSSYAADGLWVAHYGVGAGHPGIDARWLIHQYTSSPLDTNVAQFDSRAAMRAWAASTPEEGDMALSADDKKWMSAELDRRIEVQLRKLVYPLTWETDRAKPPAGQETVDNPTWAPINVARFAGEQAKAALDAVAGLGDVALTPEQIDALASKVAEHPALAGAIAEQVAEKLAARLAQ